MSPARLRMLSEPQVRRVLSAGGMLVESGGAWRAYRSHDARHSPAGGVSPLIAGRLRTAGHPPRSCSATLWATGRPDIPKAALPVRVDCCGARQQSRRTGTAQGGHRPVPRRYGPGLAPPAPKRKPHAARRFQRARCRPRAAQQIGSRHRARQVPSSGKPSGPFGHSGHFRAR